MKLLKDDYIKILEFYKIDFKRFNTKTIKRKAEEILANKLCRCIKKVNETNYKKNNNKNESRAIAICKSSIFNHKNLSVGKFNCKKSTKSKKNNITLKKKK